MIFLPPILDDQVSVSSPVNSKLDMEYWNVDQWIAEGEVVDVLEAAGVSVVQECVSHVLDSLTPIPSLNEHTIALLQSQYGPKLERYPSEEGKIQQLNAFFQ